MMFYRGMAAVFMLLVSAACASSTAPGAAVAGMPVSSDIARSVGPEAADGDQNRRGDMIDSLCFTSGISGFRAPGDDTVIVSRGRDDYLVETFGWCPDLDFAHSLAIKSFGSCLTRGDTLVPFDTVFGPYTHKAGHGLCRVKAIYEWKQEPATSRQETTDDVSHGEDAAPTVADTVTGTQ